MILKFDFHCINTTNYLIINYIIIELTQHYIKFFFNMQNAQKIYVINLRSKNFNILNNRFNN